MQNPSHSLEPQLRRPQASITYEERRAILYLIRIMYGRVDLGMNVFMENEVGISSECLGMNQVNNKTDITHIVRRHFIIELDAQFSPRLYRPKPAGTCQIP